MLPLSRALAGHELHVCYKVNGDYAGGNNHLINDVLKWVRLEAVCTENLNPDIVVMKPAKDRVCIDGAGPRDRATNRRIFILRPVCSDVVVIASTSPRSAS